MRTNNKTLKRALQAVEKKTKASLSMCHQALIRTNGDILQAIQFITEQRATEVAKRTGAPLTECVKVVRKAQGDIERAIWYLQANEHIALPLATEMERKHQAIIARVQLALAGHQKITTLTTAEEYHLFADNFNWDNGEKPLLHIVTQSQCDCGTALLVYWRNGPHWLCQYAHRDEVPREERIAYDLLTTIETRYLANFYTQQYIRFNPHNDDGDDLTQSYPDVVRKHVIPTILYQETPGELLPEVLRTFRFQA